MALGLGSRFTFGRSGFLLICLTLLVAALGWELLLGRGSTNERYGLARSGGAGAQDSGGLTPFEASGKKIGQEDLRDIDEDDLVELDEVVRLDSIGGSSGGEGASAAAGSTPLPNRSGPSVATIFSRERTAGEGDLARVPDTERDSSQQLTMRDILEPLSDPSNSLDSDRIYGIRTRSGAVSSSEQSSGAPAAGPASDATPNAPLLPWVTGQSRGYTMLYAMHPRARPVVESHVTALLDARVREPYIGVLVDGTFNKDYQYLRTVIDRLSQDGRRLTVALYLSNGATMRRFKNTAIPAPFVKIDPALFRNLIRTDPDTREQFSRIANEAARLFRYNQEAHPQNPNLAVVMLEDNLDADSYSRMRLLAQRSLSRVALFVRNPCVGCYPGNDGNSLGDSREEHALSLFNSLAPGDGYSLDGVGFAYPGEAPFPGVLVADQVLELMRQAALRRLQYVGLWRGSWQGIFGAEEVTIPDSRSYVASSAEQRQFEIQALRAGLQEEVPLDSSAAAQNNAN
jgi:hypothetical protein